MSKPAYFGKIPLEKAVLKLLSFFTKIYPNEIKLTLSLFFTVFILLMAYYLAKPVRESWLAVSVISDLSKIEVKAYSGFLQSIVLIALLPLYSKLFDRLPRGKLLVNVNLFFILLFPVFWVLRPGFLSEQIPFSGVAFYIWIGIFAVFVIAQFWSFAADLYDEDSGKRLFPLIALGATSGAVVGSMLSAYLLKDMAFDSYDMLLIAPIPLLIGTLSIYYIDRNITEHSKEYAIASSTPIHSQNSNSSWKIILNNRYLFLIAVFIFLLNLVTTNGENILFAAIQESIAQEHNFSALSIEEGNRILKNSTAEFYSRMYFWVNLISMILQAFIVSRILLYGGVAGILLIPPFVSLASYAAMSSVSGLSVLSVAKTAENATNYSITNTARHILWLPVTREALYKAKTTIDTMCVRFADGFAALTVIVGTRALSLNTQHFFIFNMVIIIVWVYIAVLIIRERRLISAHHEDVR
ncbi:MAG: hypothetical protein HQL46_01155 [Gammaproteobacteria bacterium]|nr:hypothetical protein [Gammaproteobacteria bacterium]